MLTKRMRILCCREIMRSLRESVQHLLVEQLETLGLSAYFEISDHEIACLAIYSELIFVGLWQNTNQLKSLESVGLCWIEESESVSQRSLETLTPIMRATGSELWLSCNPDSPDAPVQDFIDGRRSDTRHSHVIFTDNPWFPAELEGDCLHLQTVDDDAYRHVWLGQCRTQLSTHFATPYSRSYAEIAWAHWLASRMTEGIERFLNPPRTDLRAPPRARKAIRLTLMRDATDTASQ